MIPGVHNTHALLVIHYDSSFQVLGTACGTECYMYRIAGILRGVEGINVCGFRGLGMNHREHL